MPRDDFSPNQIAAKEKSGTRPVYLVEIGFDMGGGVPWRITSYGQNITVTGGDVWTANGCRVSGLRENFYASSCNVTVADADRAVYSLVVAQGLEKTVDIYSTRLPDGNTTIIPAADVIHVFSGIVSSLPRFGLQLVFGCKASAAVKRAPAIKATAPVNNWFLPPGTVIKWGRDSITIEA